MLDVSRDTTENADRSQTSTQSPSAEAQPTSDVCDFSSKKSMRPGTDDQIEVLLPEHNQYYAGYETNITDNGGCVDCA